MNKLITYPSFFNNKIAISSLRALFSKRSKNKLLTYDENKLSAGSGKIISYLSPAYILGAKDNIISFLSSLSPRKIISYLSRALCGLRFVIRYYLS